MKSLNFEQLKPKFTELAETGAFVEQYAYSDPKASIFHARAFVESLVKSIYKAYGEDTYKTNLIDLLKEDFFVKNTPKVILDKLHIIRKLANSSVHGQKTTSDKSLLLLKQLYDIAKWFARIYLNVTDFVDYQEPSDTSLKIEEDALVKEQKIQIQKLQEELEKVKSKELKTVSIEENTHISKEELKYNEDETRVNLIDIMIEQSGWDIKPISSKIKDREHIYQYDTEEVKREYQVNNQPTTTGVGYVDYVLCDKDGTILAVIEAKRTSVDVEKGKKQASLYADAIEKSQGYRPVIFYTNGFETRIWDDAQNTPPRLIWGMYSRDSLKKLIFQRNRNSLENAQISDIAGRDYQLEAIRAVSNKFSKNQRKALIVLATGTGKTRVAISISKLLQDNNWAKKILFLCDRNALLRQAKRNFKEHLGSNPSAVVSSKNKEEMKNATICFATYPSMMNQYTEFDVGYFDLIIADESHRSIYNIYADIFKYFDCYQIGLTATPVDFINRNTFDLFDCDTTLPTAYYSLEDAVREGNLVNYNVYTHSTKFLRDGIKYNKLTDEQKKEVEEKGYEEEDIDINSQSVGKKAYNKDTDRLIIRNLMENGLKDKDNQKIGKSIIFSRGHKHAILIQELIDEMYPQYGGKLSAVIDSHDTRAQSLLDDFSEINNPMRIAVSVDMLDTGVDVPEVVNLVFAKPVKSKVKFWQMIGRGTRLCKNLYGDGQDKEFFKIFDHWGNFEYFDELDEGAEKSPERKSLLQSLFETNLNIAVNAKKKDLDNILEDIKPKLVDMINRLPTESVSVKEKRADIAYFSNIKNLDLGNKELVLRLKSDIAPLMQWIDIEKQSNKIKFDLLIARLQNNLYEAKDYTSQKEDLITKLDSLPTNLTQVKNKQEVIDTVKSSEFWEKVNYFSLSEANQELRPLADLFENTTPTPLPPRYFDITEDRADEIIEIYHGKLSESMQKYKEKFTDIIHEILKNDTVMNKIKQGIKLSKNDFDKVISLILTQNPTLDKPVLKEFFPNIEALEHLLMSISGINNDMVKTKFSEFIKNYSLSDIQMKFLNALQQFIIQHNGINISDIDQAPFTSYSRDGIDGLFEEDQVDEIIEIIKEFPQHKEIKI